LLVQDSKAHSEPAPSAASSQDISQRETAGFEDSLLIRYLRHDPSHQEDRLQAVESALTKSLGEWTDTKPAKVKQALLVLLDLAACWEIAGNSDRAADLNARVAALCQEYLEPTDALTVSALIDMAVSCHRRGRSEQAESLLKRVLELCEANSEAMSLYGPRVLMNLAAAAGSRGQAPIASCYLDRALEVAEQAPEPDRYHIMEVLCNQAKACVAMKQRERFDQVASRALNEAKAYWKSDPDFATECIMTLFGLYQSQGRFDEARTISKTLGELTRR
jgi:tetratricopeptide (TPR) repeat protein